MVPREVWDKNCMPESMLEEKERHLAYSLEIGRDFNPYGPVLYDKWIGQFEKFKHLIRPENWCIGSDTNEHDDDIEYFVETFSVYMDIDPNQIPNDLIFTIENKISETLWEIVKPYREIARRDEGVHDEELRNMSAVFYGHGNIDSDSEGLNGRYELSDSGSESESEVAGNTGGTSY